jgi:hypothetical protein
MAVPGSRGDRLGFECAPPQKQVTQQALAKREGSLGDSCSRLSPSLASNPCQSTGSVLGPRERPIRWRHDAMAGGGGA